MVDDEDYDWLMTWKWHTRKDHKMWYAASSYKDNGLYLTLPMHRILTMCPPNLEVDHIDHNGLNNQKSNLSVGTHRENMSNRNENTTSKYVGVSWRKNAQKWQSAIVIENKKIYLGLFDIELEAHLIYQSRLNQQNYIEKRKGTK